ncbi:MAG: patatin-like phospholipase family protein [Oscillospiraceae bacterium]|nr:patatin-like phospholipase family protein [Oscillospiraceae bacterium]
MLFTGLGVYGAAQVGVLRALEEAGRPPDVLAGVETGAWVAGLYACLQDAGRVRDALARACDMGRRLADADRRSAAGMIRGERLAALLDEQTGRCALGNVPLALAIPALALPTRKVLVFASRTPADGGDLVWTRQASLALAIRAALAIPLLVRPAMWMGVPLLGCAGVGAAAQALTRLGAQRVLVVHAYRQRPRAPYGPLDIAALAAHGPEPSAPLPPAWQAVSPRLPADVHPGSLGAFSLCVQAGYEAALEALPRCTRAWGQAQGRVLPFQRRY